MRAILKMTGSLLVIALLIAHFFLIALFVAPSHRLLGLLVQSEHGFLKEEEWPEPVENFLITNNVGIYGDYQLGQGSKEKLILSILQFRREYIMDFRERLTLDANLLDYGEGVIGIQAASQRFYQKPLSEALDKEWITLINLHDIFSKK